MTNQAHLWGKTMFGPTVAVLRPGTPVESVEDPVLYERGRTALKSQKETRSARIMEATFDLMKEMGVGLKDMIQALMLELSGAALAQLEAQEKVSTWRRTSRSHETRRLWPTYSRSTYD